MSTSIDLLNSMQRSKIFFIGYLSIPFALFAVTQYEPVFYAYFLASLLFLLILCIIRIAKDEDRKDYDLGILTIVKIANICTILYTPKEVWIVSGLIIFTFFMSFCHRHSRIGFNDISKKKFSFTLYLALFLILWFKTVDFSLLLGVYGIQLAFVFAYLLLCALRTNMFYRGILYGSVALITLVLIGRYSVQELSMFYLYVESVFIGLCYLCYLNWYNHFVYLHYLPFVRKQKSNRFFAVEPLFNMVAIVAACVVLLNYPLTKTVIINSCLTSVFVWILYSTVVGVFNLGENSKDIADYYNDEEIILYYESLPFNIKLKIKKEVETIWERRERSKKYQEICEALDSLPEFLKHIGRD